MSEKVLVPVLGESISEAYWKWLYHIVNGERQAGRGERVEFSMIEGGRKFVKV